MRQSNDSDKKCEREEEPMSARTFEDLRTHIGHVIVCVGYGQGEMRNVAVECETCHEVLVDYDKM